MANQAKATQLVTLPVGIVVSIGKKQTTIKEVEVRSISMADSYAKMMETTDENALSGLIDLAAMSYVPELERTLTYDELMSASRQDGSQLEYGRMIVEKKEREVQISDD